MSNRFYDHTTFPLANSLASSSGLRAELDLVEAGFTAVEAEIDGKAASNHTHAISNITSLQTALDGKAASNHTHNYAGSASAGGAAASVAQTLTRGTGLTGSNFNGSAATTWAVAYGTTAGTACEGNDARLSNARPASDVYAWAKAASKPTYTAAEVGAAASNHTHSYLPLAGGSLTGAVTSTSTIVVNNTTASTSATTGSLRTTGGLGVGGAIYAGGNITAYSDARLKTDVVEIPDALVKVRALRGVTYTRIDTGDRQTGVIAQEVQAVLPEAVSGDQYLGVAYGNMVGLLIQAIKEQADQIDQLKSRIQRLEAH